MRDMKNEDNELKLSKLGYVKIADFSRYMFKDEEIMSISRMKPIVKRKDGRVQLMNDRDVRLNMKWESALDTAKGGL